MAISPEKVAELLRLRIVEHKTLSEIEKIAHVDKKTAVKYTSKAWNKERDRLIEEVRKMRNEKGNSIQEVMNATGLSRSSVVRYSRLGDGARRSTHWKQKRHVVYQTSSSTDYLEDTDKDDFEWTAEELAEAVRLARQGIIETEDTP